MAISATTANASTQTEAIQTEVPAKKWFTKEKVKEVGKKVFAEMVFWGSVALAVVTSVVVIKLAFSNPITAIVVIALGCLAFRFRRKIAYIATMYLNVFKNFLGVTKYNWFNKINDNIVLGAIPLENKEHPKLFKAMNITDVLSLNEKFELETTTLVSKPVTEEILREEGINFKQFPSENSKPIPLKTLDQAVDFIDKVAKRGGRVYVTCREGKDRGPMVVACYLIKYKNFTLEKALEHVRKARPSVALSTAQIGRIYEYLGYLGKPSVPVATATQSC